MYLAQQADQKRAFADFCNENGASLTTTANQPFGPDEYACEYADGGTRGATRADLLEQLSARLSASKNRLPLV